MASDASCTAHVTFSDGDVVAFTARGKKSHPDAMADLRAETVNGFRAIHREVREVKGAGSTPMVISFQEPDDV